MVKKEEARSQREGEVLKKEDLKNPQKNVLGRIVCRVVE